MAWRKILRRAPHNEPRNTADDCHAASRSPASFGLGKEHTFGKGRTTRPLVSTVKMLSLSHVQPSRRW